jgi:hypothetical protein
MRETEVPCTAAAWRERRSKVRSCTICCHSLRHDSGSRCHGVRFPCKKFYRPYPLSLLSFSMCCLCRNLDPLQALAMSADNRRS